MREILKRFQDTLFSADHRVILREVTNALLDSQLGAVKAELSQVQTRLLKYLLTLPRRTTAEEKLLQTLSALAGNREKQ